MQRIRGGELGSIPNPLREERQKILRIIGLDGEMNKNLISNFQLILWSYLSALQNFRKHLGTPLKFGAL